MKILKKISLKRGLERILQPNPSIPKFTRGLYKKVAPYTLMPEQQLNKYSVKPSYYSFKWTMALVGGCIAAIFWRVYINQLYKNELDTIYRYRYHEQQNSSTFLRIRLFFMKTLIFLQSNYGIGAMFKRNTQGRKQLQEFTQGTLRYAQYKYYMQNKNKKYDFLDLGILQKFPYAKKTNDNIQ